MLQHGQRNLTEDERLHHPEALEQLPELPEGVVIPDDLSGLERHPRAGVRWLRWAVVLVLTAGAALLGALLLNGRTESAEERIEDQTRDYYENLYSVQLTQQRVEDQTRAYYENLTTPQIVEQRVEDQTRAYYENLTTPQIVEQRIDDDVRAYYENLYDARATDDTPDALVQQRIDDDIRAYYEQLYESLV